MTTYTQPCGYAVTVDASDLIHIFKPYSFGSSPTTGYKANSNYGGQDLSKIFQPRDGSPAIGNTNYRLSDGTDLAIVFMDINYIPYSATIIDNGSTVTPNIYIKNTAYYQFNNVGSNSSFQIYNPTAPIVVNYILIGGGGGGGSSGSANTGYPQGPGSGTGGEAGECTYGNFSISIKSNTTYYVTIGQGGSGGPPPPVPPNADDQSNGNPGGQGTTSTINQGSSNIYSSNGGRGGYGGYNPDPGGKHYQSGPNNTYSPEEPNQYYGGGGGNGSAGNGNSSGQGDKGGDIGGAVKSYDGSDFNWGGGGGGGNALNSSGIDTNSYPGGSNNINGYGGNSTDSNQSGGTSTTPGGGGGGGVSIGGGLLANWAAASGGGGCNGTLLIWWTIPS